MKTAGRLALTIGAVALTPVSIFAQGASTCPERTTCTYYCPQQVEVLLELDIDPDEAEAIVDADEAPANLSSDWKSVRKRLRRENARLRPSVPRDLARKSGMLRTYTVQFREPRSASDLERVAKKLRKRPGLVRKVARVSPARPPSDPWVASPGSLSCTSQWYIQRSGIDRAWDCGATGSGVTVAVVDSGFMYDHVDLRDAYDPTYHASICDPTADLVSNVYSYHGAGSVGLVAARKNATGIQGVAYESAIRPVVASCDTDDHDPCDECWSEGNPWAAAIAKVISWHTLGEPSVLLLETQTCCQGNFEGSLAVNAAIKRAVALGIVVVVPAGNGNQDAGCSDQGDEIDNSGAIVVGATSAAPDNPLTYESNYGSRVDVSAPGENDLTCGSGPSGVECAVGVQATDTYTREYGGTSGASAIVAGVVALMLQKNPALSPADVLSLLKETGTPIGPGKDGGVFLNAAGAIAAVDPNGCGGTLE